MQAPPISTFCVAGETLDVAAQQCVPCPARSYCPSGTEKSVCSSLKACPLGSSSEVECAPGLQADIVNEVCVNCTAGYKCQSEGEPREKCTVFEACPEGTANSTVCVAGETLDLAAQQ